MDLLVSVVGVLSLPHGAVLTTAGICNTDLGAAQAGLNNFFSMPTPTDAGGLFERWHAGEQARS